MKPKKIKFDVAKVFGVGKPGELFVTGYDRPGPFVPKEDPAYWYDQESVELLTYFLETGTDGLMYIGGPTGAGKSSFVKNVCARLNLPMQRINFRASMQSSSIYGSKTVIGGDIMWMDGAFTSAIRYGHILLTDELDAADPQELLGANTVAEGGDLTLDDNGGEVVERHPDFRWIATANTFGNGSANYQRNVQDAAFLDRAFLMEMKYLPREVEVSMLQQRFPEMDVRLLGQYVDVANAVRAAYTGESAKHGIELTMSTRSLIRWVQTSIDFKPMASRGISPIHKALNHSIALRAEPTTQMFLHEEVQRMFGTTYKPN